MKKLLFLSILSLFFITCEKDIQEPIVYQVKYEITGSTTSVNITYENEQGGTSQVAEANVPWLTTFQRVKGSFVYLSAQNKLDEGTVTVTIYRDGSSFKTSTSTGGYVIATASGLL